MKQLFMFINSGSEKSKGLEVLLETKNVKYNAKTFENK